MYLLDSNIYINFYDRYYKMNYFPTFWSTLPSILNSNVKIAEVILDENYQDPSFKEWLAQNYSPSLINHKEDSSEWGQVLAHVKSCGFYKDSALFSGRGWANEKIADAWLIAIAKKLNLTIVTDEARNVNLNLINPSKNAKIPDVCDQLGIRCINMNQFFDEVSLRI